MRLGARYYAAAVGRFISPDPSGYGGGLNLYQYCSNNPVNAVDPTGNVPVLLVTAAAGGVIGGVAGGAVAWISGEDAEGILRGVATGALSGVVAGLFPQSLIGAVAGGALASAAVQTYEMSLGWRCSYSGVEIALTQRRLDLRPFAALKGMAAPA